MIPLTYVELFAGAGGLSRGLETADWSCLAHAEIEPHARAILRQHWPDTPLFGDVATLTAADIHAATGGQSVTLLTGGSPCQDLSIAGKRAGMTEGSGTRSSLYFHQVRLWQELDAPYFLWENVLGALSSNDGRDFAAVLSALVGSPVAVPADGWKGGGGVVAGCTGVAAWRVLDCQYFGPPQRRRRVFVLSARAGGVDPAEVLSLGESVSGHRESRGAAGQDDAPEPGIGVAPRSSDGEGEFADGSGHGRGRDDDGERGSLTPWDFQSRRVFAETGEDPSLQAATNSGQQAPSVVQCVTGAVTHALRSEGADASEDGTGRGTPIVAAKSRGDSSRYPSKDGENVVLAFAHTLDGANGQAVLAFQPGNLTRPSAGAEPSRLLFPTLGASTQGDQAPHVVTVYDARGNGAGSVETTLPGDHLNRVTDYTPVVMRQREGKPGGGKGPMLGAESETLGTHNDQVLFPKQAFGQFETAASVDATLAARDHASLNVDIVVAPSLAQGAHPGSYNGQDGAQIAAAILAAQHPHPTVSASPQARAPRDSSDGSTEATLPLAFGRPRRLMPIECERLMGWDDSWTAIGRREDGTTYALSDSARYRAIGNGCASPVVAWIAWRLRVALDATGSTG